jgi:hypothetical protein
MGKEVQMNFRYRVELSAAERGELQELLKGGCVQVSGSTPAISVSVAHPDDRSLALPITHGAPPLTNLIAFIEQRANQNAAQLYQRHSAPLPAVPLYLRHLRLTL